jgi:hypothetical protein
VRRPAGHVYGTGACDLVLISRFVSFRSCVVLADWVIGFSNSFIISAVI